MRYYVESQRTPGAKWEPWQKGFGCRTKRAALLAAKATPAYRVRVVLVIRDLVRRTYNEAGIIQ